MGYGANDSPSSYQIDGYTNDSGPNYSTPYSDFAPDVDAQSQSAPAPAQNAEPSAPAVNNSAPPPANSGAGQTVYLYRKDGLMFAANDYWVANNQVHYTVQNGGENSIDMRDFDVQRTIDENAKRGVSFSLKPTPAGPPPADGTASIAPLTTGANQRS
jgi:hypothetical protein